MKRGHWNYRMVKYRDGGYAIHEAYYNEGEAKPYTITTDSVGISGETIKEMHRDHVNYQRALSLPVLDYETREEIETFCGTKKKARKSA